MSSRRWSPRSRWTWISRFVGALGLLLNAGQAHAEWSLGAGVEHFSWTEHTSPIRVKERGPLFVLRAGLSHPLGRDFAADFRTRLYGGSVAYDGSLLFDPTTPASATTHYLGWTLEPRLRRSFGSGFDATLGLDLDLWRRKLASDQIEDYRIVSLRLGAAHASSSSAPWRADAGIQFTLATHEDAHFQDLGYEHNPALEPGQSITPYVELGYSFTPHWSLSGSWEGFDFGRSKEVLVTRGSTQTLFFQPASTTQVGGVWLEYH